MAYVDALRRDLKQATLFVQLLGPLEGDEAPDTKNAFVELQAIEAARESEASGLRILGWCAPGTDPGAAEAPWLQELLRAKNVHACGIEEFKQEILDALSAPAPASPGPPMLDQPATPDHPPGSGPAAAASGAPLSVYINADAADRDVADDISNALNEFGVDTLVSPTPAPGQTPEEIRLAEQDMLETSDGAVIICGKAPDTWVVSQYQFDRKILTQKRGGVWGALLQAPPLGRRAPVKSPSLMMLDWSNGVDPAQLGAFVAALRSPGNVRHAG